jgi:sulfotransferase family protein
MDRADLHPTWPARRPKRQDTDTVKVLYIGGFGRSGSTLVERILGQVPGFCSAGELVFLWGRGLADNQLCGCGAAFSDCGFWQQVGQSAFGGWDAVDAGEMLSLQRMVDRNRFIPAMVAPRLRPSHAAALERYADVLDHLYRAIAEVSGARVVIDASKHASSAYMLRRVSGLDLRVIHLVRDSRGVAYSWTKQVKKPEITGDTPGHPGVHDDGAYMPVHHPARSGARWLSYNLLFDMLGTIDRTMVLRYEDVISDPRGTVERVLAHAGETVEPDGLGFLGDGWVDLGVDHTVAGNPMRFKTGRLHVRLDHEWAQKFPRKQRALVTAITWPLQLRYGYSKRKASHG